MADNYAKDSEEGKEHSENKIIMQSGLIEKETGPGVLWSSIQKTYQLQESQTHKAQATDYVSNPSFLPGILAGSMFIEHWIGAPQIQPRF